MPVSSSFNLKAHFNKHGCPLSRKKKKLCRFYHTLSFLGANWARTRVWYQMPSLGKTREILSPGRTQAEVKKYLHLLLLGGQPACLAGPSLLVLACQEGLQEKTG